MLALKEHSKGCHLTESAVSSTELNEHYLTWSSKKSCNQCRWFRQGSSMKTYCFLNQPQQATHSFSWPRVCSGSWTHSPSRALPTDADKYLHDAVGEVCCSALCSSLFTLVWCPWAVVCTSSYIFPSPLLYRQRTGQLCTMYSWCQRLPFVQVPHTARAKLALELLSRQYGERGKDCAILISDEYRYLFIY